MTTDVKYIQIWTVKHR